MAYVQKTADLYKMHLEENEKDMSAAQGDLEEEVAKLHALAEEKRKREEQKITCFNEYKALMTCYTMAKSKNTIQKYIFYDIFVLPCSMSLLRFESMSLPANSFTKSILTSAVFLATTCSHVVLATLDLGLIV